MPLNGIAATQKEMQGELDKLKQQAIGELKRGVNVALETMLAATPVWTGETVANYHVAVGAEGSAGYRAPTGGGDPGHTNAMPLGAEPRRAENESLARGEMEAVIGSIGEDLIDVVITNTVDDDKWDMIDNGSAPGGPPGPPLGTKQQLRAPGGVSRVAIQTVRSNGNWR